MKDFYLKLAIIGLSGVIKSVNHFPILEKSIHTRSVQWTIILLVLTPLLLCSCATPGPKQTLPPSSPAFNNAALTSTLQRGVSTAADVREALGEPNGLGGFLYPTDTDPLTVWFYEKIMIDTSSGKLDLQQDVLLVFLRENIFDGFLWYSDAVKDW